MKFPPSSLAWLLAALFGAMSCGEPILRERVQPKSLITVEPSGSIDGRLAPAQDPSVTALPAPPPATKSGAGSAAAKGLGVWAASCATMGCPLRLTFDGAMVEPSELAEAPNLTLRFDPPQPGTMAWESPTTLVFSPGKGAFHWGHRIQVVLEGAESLEGQTLPAPFTHGFTVPFFRVGSKAAFWPVRVGEPRFMGLLTAGVSELVGKGPMLFLYDQPVDPKAVGPWVRVRDEEENLREVRVVRPNDLTRVGVAHVHRSHVVAVQVKDLPAHGSVMAVSLPTWRKGKGRGSVTRHLEVATQFRIVEARTRQSIDPARAPLSFQWLLKFSTPVSRKVLDGAIQVTPKPTRQSSWSHGERQAGIHLAFPPGTPITVRLKAGLIDSLGNRLEKGARFSFKTRDLAPKIQLGRGDLIYERGAVSIPLETVNVKGLSITAYELKGANAFLNAQKSKNPCEKSPTRGRRITRQKVRRGFKTNQTMKRPIRFNPPKSVSFLCLVARGSGAGSEGDGPITASRLVQVTGLGLTVKRNSKDALVWVTHLTRGTHVANAKVVLLDHKGDAVGSGTTNALGIAHIPFKNPASAPRVAYALAQTRHDAALATLKKGRFSKPWQFGFRAPVAGHTDLRASVFTDRAIYRPGERVHTKIIVRAPGTLLPSQQKTVDLQLIDPKGVVILKRPLALDELGATDVSLTLKEEAALGTYAIWVHGDHGRKNHTFRVEEFRVPTFEVTVKEVGGQWTFGGTARARIQAKYLHGGTLAGRKVSYRVWRSPAPLRARGLKRFVFQDKETHGRLMLLENRELSLDSNGQATVTFSTAHPSASGPMRYRIEASVTDVDQQTYAGSLAAVVHPSKAYVGTQPPPRTIVAAGQAISVPVVAVNQDGELMKGKRVRVSLERIVSFNAKHRSRGGRSSLLHGTERSTLQKCTVRTRLTPTHCSLTPPTAGKYRVVATLLGRKSRTSPHAAWNVRVSGSNRVEWQRFQHERITVVTDKASYRAGEEARLLIQSPFDRAKVLLTVERDGILEERTFQIRGDTPVVTLQVKNDWAPNVFVSVVLLSPRRSHRLDGSGSDTGGPKFRMGMVELKVAPRDTAAHLTLTTKGEVRAPGDTVTVKINARVKPDSPEKGGLGLKGSATVWVVDEGILGLAPYPTPNPLKDFLPAATLGVETASNYLDLLGAATSRNETIFPGGGGDEFDESDDPPRPPAGVRSLFKSTAFWSPAIPINDKGEGHVTFKLPDNVTTWRIYAVFHSRGRRSASTYTRMRSAKPLMIQPSLPRFAYPGDTFTAGATLTNATPQAGVCRMSGQVSGAEFTGPLQKNMTLASNASERLDVRLTVARADRIRLNLSGTLANAEDRVQVSLPILDPGSQQLQVRETKVAKEGHVSLTLPARAIAGSETLQVIVSTSRLTRLGEAVGYLMGYPYGCIEQTTSRALPLVLLEDLLPDMGVTVDPAQLRKFSDAGIKRILSFQTHSGGLSYWPGGTTPHAFGTGFGLTALIAAKKKGYEVPDLALERIGDYLVMVLNRGEITQEMPHGAMADGDTRAFLVMQLGRLGRPQSGMIARLWQSKSKLTPFGLAFLAVAARECPGSEALSPTILAAIRSQLHIRDSEAVYRGKSKGGGSMDSSLRTHAASLLAFAEDGRDPTTKEKLLEGLLNRSKRGRWGNTQENVFGIMSVARSVASDGAPDDGNITLSLNGRELDLESAEILSPRVRRVSLTSADLGLTGSGPKELTLRVTTSGRPVYLKARLAHQEELTPATMAPVSKGFVLEREIMDLKGHLLSPRSLRLGQVVRVRLRVSSKENRHYVAVDDRLPAGLEALNLSLTNTGTISMGALSPEVARGLKFLSHHELRDERVLFFADSLPAGTAAFEYLARATTAGDFTRPGATVEAMYEPDVRARTAFDRVRIQ